MKFRILTEAYEDEFQAYVTNLGAYNDGELRGEWVTFPIEEEEFNDILDSIGCNEPGYEEWFVSDYDDPFGNAYSVLGEYPSLEQLNEYGEMTSGSDAEAFAAILEDQMDWESAKDILEKENYRFYPGVHDWTELAEMIIDESGGVDNIPKDLIEQYFDYDQLGRDLSFDEYEDPKTGEDVSAGEYWCNDENASDEDIGYCYVDAVGFEGVAHPETYFDFDEYGRFLSMSDFAETDNGIIEYFK